MEAANPILCHAGALEIAYPAQNGAMLLTFVRMSIEAERIPGRDAEDLIDRAHTVILQLRATQGRFKCGYPRVAAVVAGAVLLQRVSELDLTEKPGRRPGVKLALRIGITTPEHHGLQRLIRILADAQIREPEDGSRRTREKLTVGRIVGEIFNVDFQRAVILTKTAEAFWRAMKYFAKEGEGIPCVCIVITNGVLSLRGDHGEIAEINLGAIPDV
jgi:hypothetical protein